MRWADLSVTLRSAIASVIVAAPASATQAQAPAPIASVAVEGVKVSGAIEVSGGNAILASGGAVTAGDKTAKVLLPGRGEIRVCQTTTVHLSRDRSIPATSTGMAAAAPTAPVGLPSSSTPGTGGLMVALDRGALEASYATGNYSDVLMTPDFRILISGPGMADVRLRVSQQGDTCVENRGANAPYVTVSSQLEEGLYRVQPDQRVLFEHGSLHEVVDQEKEPCGCPPPPDLVAASPIAGTPGKSEPSAAVDTTFPLAQSEGLAPTPTAPPSNSNPGETQTQVTVPLVYNGAAPPPATPASAPVSQAAAAVAQTTAATPPPKHTSDGVFHRIGRFFSRLFGK